MSDLIMDAIREHIGADEVALVTHYVVTAAIIQPDGSEATITLPSPGMPLWQQHGLLSYEASGLVPQPIYEQPDEDEEEQ